MSLEKYFGHYTHFFSFSGMLNLMFVCYVLLSCFTKMATVFGTDLHSCQFLNNSDLQCLCSLCCNVRFLPRDQLRMCTLLLRKKHRRRPHILQNGISLLNIAECKISYYLYLLLGKYFHVNLLQSAGDGTVLIRYYFFGLTNYLLPLQDYLNSADDSTNTWLYRISN